MTKFKIVYWLNGNIQTAETEAKDKATAKMWFMLCIPHDDIISIEEVK